MKTTSEEKGPINYAELIETFFRTSKNEKKYIKPLMNRILSGDLTNFIPELRLELKDLDNPLLILFRERVNTFLDNFKEGLYKRLLFERDIKELFELFNICAEDMHIIPNVIGFENLIPEIVDFSQDLKDYREKICSFVGRYLNIGLERAIEFKKMVFECFLCGSEFTITPIYRKTRERYQMPNFCSNRHCKAKNKTDFHLLEEKCETFEIRKFSIGDIDINKEIEEKKCIIRKNISYFIEKAKNINLNEEIEILGILHVDIADLYLRKEEQELLYYIDVLDIKPRESKIIDENIVKELYNQLEKNPLYCNEIIDSIHPYSKGIYDYFPAKLLMTLSFITCDSWDEKENKRNSLNTIIGGHKGSLKTRMSRAFQEILGQNMFGIIYGGKTTAIGLIPTAQRNNKEKNLVKRYGALAYYNRKTLVIDEFQYLKDDAKECLKYLDDGKIERAMDGLIINAPAKESVILSLNYKTKNESYDNSKPLIENIGFPEDQLSILDRFDLHYSIPKLKKRNNQILFRRNFRSINNIKSKEHIYNYLFEAKRLYSEGITINQELIDVIENLNNYFFEEKKADKILTPREPIIITKLVKGISALKFKKDVDDSDIEYLKKHLINTIIPFQENSLLSKIRIIDINEIFQKTFILLTELYTEIPITEHIDFIREFLESHYFSYNDYQIRDPVITNKIDEYMPDKTSLGENRKYRTLIEEYENVNFIEKKGYIIGKKDNKTHFINGKLLDKTILNQIKEIFKENKNKPIEVSSLIPILEIAIPYEKNLIINSIDFHIKNKNLIKTKENYLQLEGEVGGKEEGEK